MSLIFAGAPIINAGVALATHPPAGGYGTIKWQFYAGILAAAIGGCLVTLYKPAPAAPQKQAAAVESGGAKQPVDSPPAQ